MMESLKQQLMATLTRSHDGLDIDGLEAKNMREIIAALEVEPVGEDMKAILSANMDKVRKAASALGSDATAYCAYTASQTAHAPEIRIEWGITIMMPGLSRYCFNASGSTIEEAIEKCTTEIRSLQNLCPICGGRMDGPCKHSH